MSFSCGFQDLNIVISGVAMAVSNPLLPTALQTTYPCVYDGRTIMLVGDRQHYHRQAFAGGISQPRRDASRASITVYGYCRSQRRA